MKNTILFLLLAGFVFTTQSCSKTGSTNNTAPDIINPPNGTGTLTVNLSQNQLTADGLDETTITVKDANNSDVTSTSTISINNATVTSNKFYTSVAGSYQVRATRGADVAAAVTITATNPSPSPFTQKVVAEFFTGTWCGICPGTIIPLENYTSTHPNIITIGVHGPAGSSDPFKYIFDPQMRATFNIGGVPTVLLNRDSKWVGNNTGTLDMLAQKRAPLGIAVETSITGSIVNVRAKVKFDVTTTLPFKIVVVLAEDNLLYNQANYGHFGLPNPITNFNHRNVLRTAATDIFGEAIPAIQQMKGNTWQKDYSINAAGYNTANSRIIAFVVYGDNNTGRNGVVNAQIVTAGQNKDFD